MFRKFSVLMAIVLMGLMLVNKAAYVHVHVMPDGSIVSHAHPFNKAGEQSNGKQHHHHSLEFFLLDQIEVLGLTALTAFAFFNAGYNFTRSLYSAALLPSLFPYTSPGRAPPVYI